MWRNLTASDVGKVVEGEAEVFGKEVAREVLVEAVNDTEEACMSLHEGFVMAGIGDDDVVCSGGQIGLLGFLKDALF